MYWPSCPRSFPSSFLLIDCLCFRLIRLFLQRQSVMSQLLFLTLPLVTASAWLSFVVYPLFLRMIYTRSLHFFCPMVWWTPEWINLEWCLTSWFEMHWEVWRTTTTCHCLMLPLLETVLTTPPKHPSPEVIEVGSQSQERSLGMEKRWAHWDQARVSFFFFCLAWCAPELLCHLHIFQTFHQGTGYNGEIKKSIRCDSGRDLWSISLVLGSAKMLVEKTLSSALTDSSSLPSMILIAYHCFLHCSSFGDAVTPTLLLHPSYFFSSPCRCDFLLLSLFICWAFLVFFFCFVVCCCCSVRSFSSSCSNCSLRIALLKIDYTPIHFLPNPIDFALMHPCCSRLFFLSVSLSLLFSNVGYAIPSLLLLFQIEDRAREGFILFPLYLIILLSSAWSFLSPLLVLLCFSSYVYSMQIRRSRSWRFYSLPLSSSYSFFTQSNRWCSHASLSFLFLLVSFSVLVFFLCCCCSSCARPNSDRRSRSWRIHSLPWWSGPLFGRIIPRFAPLSMHWLKFYKPPLIRFKVLLRNVSPLWCQLTTNIMMLEHSYLFVCPHVRLCLCTCAFRKEMGRS